MDASLALEQAQCGLLNDIQKAISKRGFNHRAEQIYLHWISRFFLFHDLKNPEDLDPEDRLQFVDYLEKGMGVSRAKLNQANQALEFLYEEVLSDARSSDEQAA